METVHPEEIDLNIDTLTLGEAEQLEEMIGVNLSNMGDVSQVRLIRSMVTLSAQRTNPEFTYEDTADMLLNDMVAKLGEADDSDPSVEPLTVVPS